MRPTAHLIWAALFALPNGQAAEYLIPNRDPAALIRAIQASERSPEADVIHLAEAGIYTLDLTDSRGLALPSIGGQLRIEGHGAEIRRYADQRMRFLEVEPGGVLHVLDLGLAEASLGAVQNAGHLTLDRVSITDSENDSQADNAIIANHGRLLLRDSLIGYNQIRRVEHQGAIVINHGTLALHGTRFVGNAVQRSSTEAVAAGAVLNYGRLRLDGGGFDDNAIADPLGELALSGVVNQEGGRVDAVIEHAK